MIRFNLEPDRYKVNLGYTASGWFLAVGTCFAAALFSMLAYGSIIPKFFPEAPRLGYLVFLASFLALRLTKDLLFGTTQYKIEIEKLEE